MSDFLWDFESQSWRFEVHLEFHEFFRLKGARSSSHKGRKRDVLFLPTFDKSTRCKATSWVKELDAYFQLHQVTAKEAIIIAALHLKGMAHDWWLNFSVSCYHASIETYDEFTKALVKRFYENQCESSCEKCERSNTLHELEEKMKQTPLHISRGEENQDDHLLKASLQLYEGHSSIYDDMKILLSKED